MRVVGIVLAAGAGTRAGGPKALRPGAIAAAVSALRDGGCDPVLVVLGAGADAALPLVPPDTTPVVADDWADGVSASLRAGLRAAGASAPPPDAALVTLVDLPELPAAAVSRLLDVGPVLARATHDGRPGHPVLLPRTHWDAVAAAVQGDTGAGPYLRAHAALAVECGDLWDGADDDGPRGAGSTGVG